MPNKPGTKWTEADYAARGYKRINFRAPLQFVELWKRAVEHADDESLSAWMTAALTLQAADELKLDPIAALGGTFQPRDEGSL